MSAAGTAAAFVAALAGAVLGLASCQTLGPQRLYALPLVAPPTESDWAGAVPLRLDARGGRTSRPGDADVDSDAVHTATASCHHGTGGAAVELAARAFYTPDRLYLRVEWTDPTEDAGPTWHWKGKAWVAAGSGEDGLGLLWGRPGEAFSCERACHLRDWRMADRSFADYVMKVEAGSPPRDLWVWKAGRGRPGGMADDWHVDAEARKADGPGERFAPNSVRARAGEPQPFGPGDAPLRAPEPQPGATAAAYVVLAAPPGRTEVEGFGVRVPGGWRVTLSRALAGSDADDVRPLTGRELDLGVATLDAVSKDHNAVPQPIRLVLVERAALVASKE